MQLCETKPLLKTDEDKARSDNEIWNAFTAY